MFIKDALSSNMLRYKLGVDEKPDALEIHMIQGNDIPEIFIPGIQNIENETYILIPVAGYTPLKEYLREDGCVSKSAEILKQFFRVMDTLENYMLHEESVVKAVEYAFVCLEPDGSARLKMAYLPTFGEESEPYYKRFDKIFDNRDFVRNVLACGCYVSEEAETVVDLLNFINSDAYSEEMLLMKISEHFPEHMHNPELSTDDFKEASKEKVKRDAKQRLKQSAKENPKESSKESSEESPKERESLLKRWLSKQRLVFGSMGMSDENRASDDSEEEIFMPYEVQRPVDICVISVRRTGEEYPLSYGPDIIGTDELVCSICFPACADMEKEHCGVFLKNGKYYIEDYGSKQGTFLNGQRIEPNRPVALSSADLIAVSGEEMVFSVRKKHGI